MPHTKISVLYFFKKRFIHLVGPFSMLRFKLNQKLRFCSSIFMVKLAWNTYREIVCGNLTLIFNLFMYLVESSTVFIHLD